MSCQSTGRHEASYQLNIVRGGGVQRATCADCGLAIRRPVESGQTMITNPAPWLTEADVSALTDWRVSFPECAEEAAYQAHVAAEMEFEARYPHVDFPDGQTFSRAVVDVDEFLAGDAAHQAAIRSHRDAF